VDATLHVGQPNIGDQERFFERVRDAFERKWLTNDGPYVRELEERIELLLAVKHCICVANATLGLQFLARALAMEGEVIVPSFTFIATPHAVLWEGMMPVFAEVDAQTHCIDPHDVARLITDKTSAICGVHLWGTACEVELLQGIADDNGLALYFDAAHAFGCSGHSRLIGNFGDAEVFSFHATKFFHSFEGGAITTNDDDLAERLRRMRNFGFAGDNTPAGMLGINAKMNEINAAMGLTNLESLDSFIETNAQLYKLYSELLSGVVKVYEFEELTARNYQYVVIETDDADHLKDVLWEQGIRARRYFSPPCHLLPPYNYVKGSLPVTEALAKRTLCLPTGMNVSEEDVARVCDIIRGAL